MIVLAIETSTNNGSIALLSGENLLFSQEFAADRSLGSLLFQPLQNAIGMVPKIDSVVVGLGPGSYSGVRIAISAAIGLSVSTGANLLGISSLAAFKTEEPAYFAIGDARRNTFYFTSLVGRECVQGPLLLTSEELLAQLESTSLPIFASASIPDFPQTQLAFPSAEILAMLASQGKGIIASGDLEPIYLRDPHITMPRQAKS